jgi:hypothetical protein
MTTTDKNGLNEAYCKVIQTQQQVIQEGVLDRTAARAAGFLKSLKPTKRLGAAAASGLGKLAGKFSPEAGQKLQQVGSEMRGQVQAAGKTGKINSILNSHKNKINGVAQDIVNDLNKLQLNVDNITPDQISSQVYSSLESMLLKQLAQSSTVGSSQTTQKPTGQETSRIEASEITGDPNDFDYFVKYNNGWFKRSGSKASGFSYTPITDKNLVNSLDSKS